MTAITSPSEVLVILFLGNILFGFPWILAQIFAIILDKVRKIFQDRGKKSKKIYDFMGKNFKIIQYLVKKAKIALPFYFFTSMEI